MNSILLRAPNFVLLGFITVTLVSGCQTLPPQDASLAVHQEQQGTSSSKAAGREVSSASSTVLSEALNSIVCIGAISDSPNPDLSWSQDPNFQMSVSEAKSRGLTPEDCVVILSEVKSTAIAKTLASRDPLNAETQSSTAPSISDLIQKHDPNKSMWQGRAWGHGGSNPALNFKNQTPKSNPPSINRVAALAFVKTIQPRANLLQILLKITNQTELYEKLEKKISPSLLKKVTFDQATAFSKKYGSQWEKILTHVYAKHFTRSELVSLAHDRRDSPHYSNYLSRKKQINSEIAENAKPLFVKAATEMLMTIVRRTARPFSSA